MSAIRFLRGEPLSMSPDRLAYRAPGYPLFLVFIIKSFFVDHLTAVRIAQALLGSCSAVLLYLITQAVLAKNQDSLPHGFSQNAATFVSFCTALSFAFMADQIFLTSIFLTETLYVFVLLLWVYLGIRLQNSASPGVLMLFSFLLGFLALIRPISLIFLPILIWKAYLTWHRNRKNYWAIGSLFIWLAPILPWTVRNLLLLNSFVFITTNSGVNFFLGHNPTFQYYASPLKEQVRQSYLAEYGPSEVGEDRYLFQLGLQYIYEYPEELIPRSLAKLYFLYILEIPPWPWDEYLNGEGLILPVWMPRWLWQCEILVFVLLGIIYSFTRKLKHGILLSVIALYTIACVVYFARTRFRMPIEPFLLIYAWGGVLSLVDLLVWGYGKGKGNSHLTD